MRLRQIDLREVGAFSAPMRIAGFGPGLNVLAGANELGKSTILKALTALFMEAHRTTKQSIKDLRPYAGGAPFVRCTFDFGGNGWRLEKQYLAAHRAVLKRLDGRETHQSADAENRLNELLGQTTAVQTSLPLLWVSQGDSFDVPELSDGVRQTLGQLLSAQAESTSGAAKVQAVLKAVNAELGELVTKTDRARKGGAYDVLRNTRAEVAAALELAQQKSNEAEQRLERLTALQQEETDLADPAAAAELKATQAELQARLSRSQDARRQLQQLHERMAFLEQQLKQRADTLADYDEGLLELKSIVEAMAAADGELRSIVKASADLDRQLEQTSANVAAAQRVEQDLAEQVQRKRVAREAASQREHMKALSAKVARLEVIAAELRAADAALADLDWPDSLLGDLRLAVQRRDALLAQKTAGSPRLTFRYATGRSSGFRLAGRDVNAGEDVLADGPITIEIEGLGEIDIRPGMSGALADLARELTAAEADVAKYLSMLGADNLADAEGRDAQRTHWRQSRALLISERDMLAPDGAQQLTMEFDLLSAALSSGLADMVAEDTAISVDDLKGQVEAARAQQAELQKLLEGLRQEKAQLDQRRSAMAAELRMRRTRREELEAKYNWPKEAEDPRLDLVEQVNSVQQQLNEATRERTAFAEIALSGEATEALGQKLAHLQTQIDGRVERLGTVRQEMRRIEGMLVRDFEDGAGGEVLELEARLADIGDRLATMERHISALRLLSAELTGETARHRDEISRPLSRRLSRLASRVWPSAELPLTSELTVGGLSRVGRIESTAAVSDGTREQVAVLARLAYSGMLAEGGEPVPLILDDPLVFSDDNRLNAVFEVMAEAAETHQILVLTCHERAFEPLISKFGATRLMLEEAAVASAA